VTPAQTIHQRTRWLRRVSDRLLKTVFFAMHARRRIAGVTCTFSEASVPQAELVSRLELAFDELRRVDPKRWRDFRRFVAHVIVWPGDYTAYDRWGGIHLSGAYLLRAPSTVLAGGLVHEAAHLRIARAGVEYRPSSRARIEARCVREEVEFLRRVPGDGDRLASEAESQLTAPWWTEGMRHERVRRMAKSADLPEWVTALIVKQQAESTTRK
jgi:hypothetical protein